MVYGRGTDAIGRLRGYYPSIRYVCVCMDEPCIVCNTGRAPRYRFLLLENINYYTLLPHMLFSYKVSQKELAGERDKDCISACGDDGCRGFNTKAIRLQSSFAMAYRQTDSSFHGKATKRKKGLAYLPAPLT